MCRLFSFFIHHLLLSTQLEQHSVLLWVNVSAFGSDFTKWDLQKANPLKIGHYPLYLDQLAPQN